MNAKARAQLKFGLQESTRLMLAAGTRKVLVPLDTTDILTRASEVDPFSKKLTIDRHRLTLIAVYPMTLQGLYHHLDKLLVSDTSLFPSSLSVPPQWTTYALGTYVGRQLQNLL